MKNAKIFLSAALAAAAVCSAAYAVTAVEDNTSSARSSDTSETSEAPETSNSDSDSDSNSGLTSHYLNLHMSGGQAAVMYRENSSRVDYPNEGGGARFHITVGCSGTITITRPGYTIISIKIGNSTIKRDMTKNSDTEYAFTILESDTDIYVVFEGEEAESSAPSTPKPAPTTPTRPEPDDYDEPATHESVPEADTNPDTGVALAIPAAALSAAAVIAAVKKKK